MPGTLSPFNMGKYNILPALPNGNVPAYLVDEDSFGGWFCAFYMKWHWDVCFTGLGGFPLVSSDFDACSQILDSGGLWDTVPPDHVPGCGTFRDIANGSDWENPTTHDKSAGIQGVSAALGYWLAKNTTRTCEQATDAQLWAAVTADLQGLADFFYTGLVTPAPPAPFPPHTDKFPPLEHGVQTALAVFIAQGSRLGGSIDPSGRVLITNVAIP